MRRAAYTLSLILSAMMLPLFAHAATLSLDPAASTYGPGDTFITSIRLNPGNVCVNAGQVEISYPPSELRVVDVTTGNSIFSLWVENPKIDSTTGTISFSGGIPAGYCGEITGDAKDSNVLAQIVFTVLKTKAPSASVRIASTSAVYLNNGLGTEAPLTITNALYTLKATPTQSSNPWVAVLSTDTTPPESFLVQVESTKDVFGGAYYAVFSTQDKQSGMDHYEIFENGAWQRVTSPHVLVDQNLSAPVQVRAIDKAGNIRNGIYDASSTPPRVGDGSSSILFTAVGIILLLVLVLLRFLWIRRADVKARLEAP